jgi:oligoendopeptidase F
MKIKPKTDWNLKLFYKSHTDPAIEADLKKSEQLHDSFANKYSKLDFTKDENSLVTALDDYEKLSGDSSGSRAIMYFYYAKDINGSDKKAEAEINRMTGRLTNASNKIIFFELNLAKIPEEDQKKFLSSSKLTHYKYFLENIFRRSKYNLSESEEKIISLKSQPARQMWMAGQDKLLSKQTILWKGKELPIAEAMSIIPSLPTKDRHALHKLVMNSLKSISDFAEAEVNAVYIDKKINDELRGFKNPYDATLLSHETDEKMVKTLVDTVTKGFKISHRFYKLKAKLLKQNKLTYADRGAGIGKTDKKIPFEEGVEIVSKAFEAMDHDFKDVFHDMLANGQIDVYPKKGKTGGAYCSANIDTPTLVLLNNVPEMRSVMTLAHEMGHAIHFEYSKDQKPMYQGVSTAVAEVASTFFEQVVFNDLFETLSKKDQIIALHNKINDEISTIFRQIACFNFENELHKEIRAKGFLSKEEIGKILNKHMKAYFGPVMEMTEEDGYFFVNWSHIRNFFYVYSYSFGCLVSKALYSKYQKDPSYLHKIKTFLSAGCSKSPRDIFGDIDIDVSDPKFWTEGLKVIEDDIKKLEKLTG